MIAYFLFYNIATGANATLAFSKEFRHCNVVIYDGDIWTNIEFDHTGILLRTLKVKESEAFIRNLKRLPILTAMIIVEIKDRMKEAWFPLWMRSCNELDRYITGVDIGYTFNPVHLYRKLLKYNSRRNYEILHAWRRQDGILRGRQRWAKSK